ATGSARLTLGATIDQTIEPEIQNNELHFHLPEIAHGDTARVLYRVRVGANAQQGNQENLAVASATFPSGEQIQTSPARASVYVSPGDRKSTRLNSSHVKISYAVFCLKKKTGIRPSPGRRTRRAIQRPRRRA